MSRNAVPGRRSPVRAAALALGLLLLGGCSTTPDGPTTDSPRAPSTASATRPPSAATASTSTSTASTTGSPRAPASTTPSTRRSTTASTPSPTTPSQSISATPTAPSASSASAPASSADLGGDLGLAGLNDPDCRSTAPPVVLLQGTLSTVGSNFAGLVPELQSAGLCAYARPFRFGGTVAVRETAAEQADFVRAVLGATGAAQVDLVGYSQGALVARTALREDDLASRVRVLVLVAGTFHGTTAALLDRVPAAVCASCVDQRADSTLLQALDAGGELDGDVRYAAVSSRADQVVTPVERQTPTGPADRVVRTLLQDRCPTSTTPHESMLADTSVRRWILDALATGGRPDPDTLSC